jgi:hypothetical protein
MDEIRANEPGASRYEDIFCRHAITFHPFFEKTGAEGLLRR